MIIKVFKDPQDIPELFRQSERYFNEYKLTEIREDILQLEFRAISMKFFDDKNGLENSFIILIKDGNHTIMSAMSRIKDVHVFEFIKNIQRQGIEYEVIDPGKYQKEFQR